MTRPSALRLALSSLLLGAAFLTGCAGPGGLGHSDRERVVSYRCDNDRSFRVDYSRDQDSAVVDTGTSTYHLHRNNSGLSGGSYRSQDGDVRLSTSGDTADLQISGAKDFQDCRLHS